MPMPKGRQRTPRKALPQGTLKGSPLATIPGSPADTSQGSSQGTLHGSPEELAAATPMATPMATPQATSEAAPQLSDPQAPPVDPKAIAPWCRHENCTGGASHKANGAAAPALLYQEPSQWPPIGASARSTSGGATASAALPAAAGLQRASSSTSLGPNPWPLIGAPSRPPSRAMPRNASRGPARATSRGPARATSRGPPRASSRGPQRRSQRSTSRAHRQPHPSVVLGCTPWAHVKAAAAPGGLAKLHAVADQHKLHAADGQRFSHYNHHSYQNLHGSSNSQQNSNNQNQTKRIYGGVPKTEPSSRMYTGILPPPPRVPMPQANLPTPHMLEDQQLGLAMSKQLSLAHTRQYTAIQKRPQIIKKGRTSEPDRNPDTPKPKGPAN
ncbi:uncharacterized protein DKFZp434B061-like [Drosophila obscura]|uniref:uncharacterized protein DKFZp434B061-like n=1 Tax=Drosophila obscura TaxID=7282 RepID=UPI001BB0F03C|nr:uncharacterized protein DKFZp434B061-like [Drosophila obscura]